MQGSFSSNSSIKMVGGGSAAAISGSIFSTTSSQYAILTLSLNNGDIVTYGSATVTATTNASNYTLYIPPSTTVSRSSGTINCSWVIFTNSP